MNSYIIPAIGPTKTRSFFKVEEFDVAVTFGAETLELVQSFGQHIERLAIDEGAPGANTYAYGHGRWGEHRESSGFLLWTGVTYEEARTIHASARTAGTLREQEAVGVFIVPANSALVTLPRHERV